METVMFAPFRKSIAAALTALTLAGAAVVASNDAHAFQPGGFRHHGGHHFHHHVRRHRGGGGWGAGAAGFAAGIGFALIAEAAQQRPDLSYGSTTGRFVQVDDIPSRAPRRNNCDYLLRKIGALQAEIGKLQRKIAGALEGTFYDSKGNVLAKTQPIAMNDRAVQRMQSDLADRQTQLARAQNQLAACLAAGG
jgi:hypothetical protein